MKPRLVLLGTCAIGVSSLAPTEPLLSQPGQYEQPPVFSASQTLPPELLRSPNYRVGERVPVENFQYVYRVDTKWGTFVIKGNDLMRMRAREMAATLKLEEINGAKTVVGAAGKTAMRPVETAKDLITAPGQTIGDTFKGVGHIFGSAEASMKAADPHNEGILASVTGGATARRKLAFDFGVDPHSSFAPLDAQLTRVATASAVGETSANAGLAFVTGGAGIAISVGGTSNQLREALRDKTVADLEKEGRPILASMGVSEPTVDAFYTSAMLTPTDKAIIVEALASLGGAAPSIEMGFFYRRQAELIAAFNKRVTPVRGFVRVGGAPMLETGKGIVSILPVDYLIWTPPLEQIVAGGKGPAEIWIAGKASQMATANLEKLGWKVVPHAGAQLGR